MNNQIQIIAENNLIANNPDNINVEDSLFKTIFNRIVSVATPKRLLLHSSLAMCLLLFVNIKLEERNTKEILIDYISAYLQFFKTIFITNLGIDVIYDTCLRLLHGKQNKNILEVLPYEQLPPLPLNYAFNKEDYCYISYEKLQKGDTVCCDMQLYSYNFLKKSYINDFKFIPHSFKPLKWNENVYRLPDYGLEKNE